MRIFEMTPLAYSKAAIPDRQLLAGCRRSCPAGLEGELRVTTTSNLPSEHIVQRVTIPIRRSVVRVDKTAAFLQ